MKKMPPALIVYTMLATLIASTPEYIILLDTDLTAAGTQGCKQFCMWLRASRWQLPCSGQYFYCQKTLSWNGEQRGTFKQWKNNLSMSFLLPGLFTCFPQTFKTCMGSRLIPPHLHPTDKLDWRAKVLMQDLLHFCTIKRQSRFQKCFNKYC